MAKKTSHKRADASIISDAIVHKAKMNMGIKLNAQDKRQNRNLYSANQTFDRSGTLQVYARFGSGSGGGTAVGR